MSKAGRQREWRRSGGGGGDGARARPPPVAGGLPAHLGMLCRQESSEAPGRRTAGLRVVAARGEVPVPARLLQRLLVSCQSGAAALAAPALGLRMHAGRHDHRARLHSRLHRRAGPPYQPRSGRSELAPAAKRQGRQRPTWRRLCRTTPSCRTVCVFLPSGISTASLPWDNFHSKSGCALHDVKPPQAIQRRTRACMCMPSCCILRRQALPLPCRRTRSLSRRHLGRPPRRAQRLAHAAVPALPPVSVRAGGAAVPHRAAGTACGRGRVEGEVASSAAYHKRT